MDRRPLGNTGLTVPICCLGTMTFGEQNSQDEGFAQMDYALERGIDFFDTAELYAIPPRPETYGATEVIIGNWMKARGNRDQVTIASKIVGRSPMNWFRPDGVETRVSPEQIDLAVEGSLRRLQTDVIDLYQIHWPDRRSMTFGGFGYRHYDDDYVSFEDTLAALGRHVDKGNIRHIGLSNETAYGMMKFVQTAAQNGLPRVVSVQNAYHLLNRTFELGAAEVAIEEKVGLLAYSPLAQGYLTGKYLNGARPAGARSTLFNRGQRYETPSAEGAIKRYLAIAQDLGLSAEQLALKFCATRPFMTSVIIGATTMEQLKTNIDTFATPWTRDHDKAIDAAHAICPNPCP